ncbi:hypothetical protein HHK36_031087 [Tetracentron sinense]|uniref:Uncharacterized protein n=1 Tax=Tetracentron sinense TaxID=13715 RepID=A0A834YAD4_TETSI|nr:hypothetical protein HHK36_031087 [Tetracentron sinense]
MIDSKSNEHGLSNTGTGSPTCVKQSPIAAKKIALRDLQNDNRIMVPKPLGNSLLKERGPFTNALKVSGTKRPIPECPLSPPCHKSPSSSGTTGHLIYARRKSESEQCKSNTCNYSGSNSSCRQPTLSHEEQETPRQQTQMKEPKISCFPAFAPIPMASLMTFSSGGPSVPLSLGNQSGAPSVPLSLGNPVSGLSLAESNYPTVTSMVPPPINPQGMRDQQWKERFLLLQTFLRDCDNSNQEDYIQMLQSLSSADLSRHAVELEKRAIQLSLEEAKEVQRMMVLNVLGKSLVKKNLSPSTQQVQSEK